MTLEQQVRQNAMDIKAIGQALEYLDVTLQDLRARMNRIDPRQPVQAGPPPPPRPLPRHMRAGPPEEREARQIQQREAILAQMRARRQQQQWSDED
jgi:hypothetical protein